MQIFALARLSRRAVVGGKLQPLVFRRVVAGGHVDSLLPRRNRIIGAHTAAAADVLASLQTPVPNSLRGL